MIRSIQDVAHAAMRRIAIRPALFAVLFACLLSIFFGAISARAASVPVLYLPTYSDVTNNSATLTGQYDTNSSGDYENYQGYFEYKKANSAGAYTRTPMLQATGGTFSRGITQLASSTTYTFHAVLIGSDNKPVATDDNSFDTPAANTNTQTEQPDQQDQQQPDQQQDQQQQQTQTPVDISTGKLTNPLSGVNTIPDFIAKILNILLKIAVPVLVCMIIWTGFQYVTAQGNPKKIETAHEMLKWTLIGAALVLGSWTLAEALSGTIQQLQ